MVFIYSNKSKNVSFTQDIEFPKCIRSLSKTYFVIYSSQSKVYSSL